MYCVVNEIVWLIEKKIISLAKKKRKESNRK